jgi:hypothetical protein
MERDDRGQPLPLGSAGTGKGGGRNDAHVSVHDVRPLGGDCVGDSAESRWREQQAERRQARRIEAPHPYSVDALRAGSRRDNHDVVAAVAQLPCEVLEVELETADPWPIPVTDQRDLHVRR